MAFGNVFRNYYHTLRAEGFIFKSHRRFGLNVINKSGSDIAADKLVCISGYDTTSKRSKIVLADADAAGLAGDLWVTTRTIANNKTGNVFQGGMSAATLDTSSFANAGDNVFLSTTAGAFTATAPPGSNARQVVVGSVQVKSASVGQIRWDIAENSTKLAATDVNRVTGRSAAVTAAVSSVAAFTATADSSYDITMNVLVTTATTFTFVCECAYTDEGNTARTATIPFRLVGSTTALIASIADGGGAVPYMGVPMRIRAKSGTQILLRTQAAGTYTTVTYNVEGSIEQIS